MHVRPLNAVALVTAALILTTTIQRSIPSQASRLSFVAVGQGDCAVFQCEGRTVLIDVGPKTDSFDAGERIVAPTLYRLGVGSIDLVIISHPDSDHVGGLPALARRFDFGRVVIPARFRHHKDMNDWLRKAEIPKEKVIWMEAPTDFAIEAYGFHLEALDDPELTEDNDGSMFVRLTGPNLSVVFTGDAGSEAERRMLAKGGDWSARILKAGHHGSRFSSCSEWLASVRPTLCVISCGRNNTYGHPSADTLRRLDRAGIEVRRTDREGTLTFDLDRRGAALEAH